MSKREGEPVCPAEQYGIIGACRFCIYLPGGGASVLCVTKVRQFERAEQLNRNKPKNPMKGGEDGKEGKKRGT